ncbi:MAG: hypothetical protein HY769_01905 [Candidatus Stahlbacteria bacterium]|nr:hypothetical protein [Candidatus Stahlbacteria bacterium]
MRIMKWRATQGIIPVLGIWILYKYFRIWCASPMVSAGFIVDWIVIGIVVFSLMSFSRYRARYSQQCGKNN